MRIHRHKTPKVLTDEGKRLVIEAEAYLAGGYAELLERRGCEVPHWAVINRIAHADIDSLRSLGQAVPVASGPANGSSSTWREARAELARTLLVHCHDDASLLVHLQQEKLIPLESEFAAHADQYRGELAALEQTIRQILTTPTTNEGP